MLGSNDASSHVRGDAQLKDQSWDVLDTNAARFEEHCRLVLGIVAQQSEALGKEGAVVQSLLACTLLFVSFNERSIHSLSNRIDCPGLLVIDKGTGSQINPINSTDYLYRQIMVKRRTGLYISCGASQDASGT